MADVGPPRIPPLGELEQAQLYSCLDLLRDRMGDALSEQAGINAILAANFDAEKALDQLLRNSVPASLSKAAKSTVKEKTIPGIQGINIWECICVNIVSIVSFDIICSLSWKILLFPLAIFVQTQSLKISCNGNELTVSFCHFCYSTCWLMPHPL